MKPIELRKIRKAMEKSLDSKRYEHTLGVEYTAAALAMRFGANMKDAQLAGALHDCAKCISDEKKLAICEKNGISVRDVERRNPSLLHGKVGRYMAEEEFGITNEDVLNAIEFHTTGRPGMSLLEKIIFISDYIEPGRNRASNLEEVRAKVFIDLDAALVQILGDTLKYLESSNEAIDPMTERTFQFYKEAIKNKKNA